MCLSEIDKPCIDLLNYVTHGTSVNFHCLPVMKMHIDDAELTASQLYVVSISMASAKPR
jgi:hypothetical protein